MEVLTPINDKLRDEALDRLIEAIQKQPCKCIIGCMGCLCRFIVARCTGRKTATMTAPLLLTSGTVRYVAVFHSCGTSPVGGQVPTCDSAHSW